MAKNIFAQMKEYVSKPNRNTFDGSFQNNLTMEFGKLYPVFCKEVLPGDSMRINPTFGLRFLPMAFPIQTRMQANLHFFYVRNRNLWKDWMDFIGRTKQNLVMPYLSADSLRKVARTRALGDYMGLPTTLVGDYGNNDSIEKADMYDIYNSIYYPFRLLTNPMSVSSFNVEPIKDESNNTIGYEVVSPKDAGLGFSMSQFVNEDHTPAATEWQCVSINRVFKRALKQIKLKKFAASANAGAVTLFIWSSADGGQSYHPALFVPRCGLSAADSNGYSSVEITNSQYIWNVVDNSWVGTVNAGSGFDNPWDYLNHLLIEDSGDYHYKIVIANIGYAASSYQDFQLFAGIAGGTTPHGIDDLYFDFRSDGVKDVMDGEDIDNLYINSDMRISALPFRAYESIYNAFYRNQQNDPFMIDGVAEYNKYIPSQEGGEDDNDYDLRYRNWELDYLTSAVQSPQQGIAPLVGVTASGTFTFDDGNGNTFTAQASVGDDGDSITGIQIQSPADRQTPLGQIQTGTLHAMQDIITNGISISDFRNVNALQRWLETNMRRGFKYKDQLMSHFGVDAKFEELDMPEFIGGMSEPVLINQVNQTTPTADDPLGSYAGQASILAQSKHDITHYCDEHGFIIGILSVSPVPNYSQLMPKMFLKHETLDFFFPEFGHIGMQPVTYNEVCPIQTFASRVDKSGNGDLDETFGYQRAWYDYIANVDEVHGLFRNSLRNFLINRQFDVKPELGWQFLHIDPEQVNDVFSVQDVTDKILGQIYFDVTMKRIIPRFGIPRLE